MGGTSASPRGVVVAAEAHADVSPRSVDTVGLCRRTDRLVLPCRCRQTLLLLVLGALVDVYNNGEINGKHFVLSESRFERPSHDS